MPLPADFSTKYGAYAVVTGASSGIGAEVARQLAATGLSLVLVARRTDRLEALAKELREQYPVQAVCITADLGTPDGYKKIVEGTTDLDVGLLVNNAGVELFGSFFHNSAEEHLQLIQINVASVTALCHAFGKRLVDRKKGGGIINISSLAREPMPYFASYCASKSFVSILSVVLGDEMDKHGIDVLSVEPGVVATDMSSRVKESVDMEDLGFKAMSTTDCVRDFLSQLGKTRNYTPGLLNRVTSFVSGFVPQAMRTKLFRGLFEARMDETKLTMA